jgi:hypothetical protein
MSGKIRALLLSLIGAVCFVLVGCDTPEEVQVEEYPSRAVTNGLEENATNDAGNNATQEQ